MSDITDTLNKNAKILHNEHTQRAVVEIAAAARRLGFKADITIAIQLDHPSMNDEATMIHITGNKGCQDARLMGKAVKILSNALDNDSPMENIHLMSRMAADGTLDILDDVYAKIQTMGKVADSLKGMITDEAPVEVIMDALLKGIHAQRDEDKKNVH